MELPLVRHTIVSLEFGFSLTLRTDRDCEIRIESNFRITELGTEVFRGLPHTLLPEKDSVQRLIGRLVAHATASDDGGLLVNFADGTSLVVLFDPDFEAWTIGDWGVLWLSVWPAVDFRCGTEEKRSGQCYWTWQQPEAMEPARSLLRLILWGGDRAASGRGRNGSSN